jgi:hypothetical protein
MRILIVKRGSDFRLQIQMYEILKVFKHILQFFPLGVATIQSFKVLLKYNAFCQKSADVNTEA